LKHNIGIFWKRILAQLLPLKKTKLGNELKESIDKIQEDNYSPYCPVCSGCGEDGCCKATMCQMSPDGSYCESYLKDLKIGYLMDEWVMENLYEQFTDEMKAAYDKKYDELIYEL
jgi:hypothetical protein